MAKLVIANGTTANDGTGDTPFCRYQNKFKLF